MHKDINKSSTKNTVCTIIPLSDGNTQNTVNTTTSTIEPVTRKGKLKPPYLRRKIIVRQT